MTVRRAVFQWPGGLAALLIGGGGTVAGWRCGLALRVAGEGAGRWALSARGMGPHGTAPKPHGTA